MYWNHSRAVYVGTASLQIAHRSAASWRFATRGAGHRPLAGVCLVAPALLLLCGCGSPGQEQPRVDVAVATDPSPPVVGPTDLRLRITDAGGKPVEGAEVRVEGNMNHAGMKPSFAEMTEVEPGEYAGTIDFTMGGDWFLLVTATMADGERVEQKVDVPGVRSQ